MQALAIFLGHIAAAFIGYGIYRMIRRANGTNLPQDVNENRTSSKVDSDKSI